MPWIQSTREIQSQLEAIYGIEVSPTLVSNVADAVHEEARAYRIRSLDRVYPILYFDALVVKSREGGPVKSLGRVPDPALGINL